MRCNAPPRPSCSEIRRRLAMSRRCVENAKPLSAALSKVGRLEEERRHATITGTHGSLPAVKCGDRQQHHTTATAASHYCDSSITLLRIGHPTHRT
jgi:hypothetical protein